MLKDRTLLSFLSELTSLPEILMMKPYKGRSMVIISHPLSRLVNSWHHKFHKLGIEHEQGLKLIRLVFFCLECVYLC